MNVLHEEVLDQATARLLANLGSTESFSTFYLAGGTGLALQLGHRRSVDLDLFSERKWSPTRTLPYLASFGEVTVDIQDEDTFSGRVGGVRMSLFYYRYPLIEPTVPSRFGIPLAGLRDIAAMKLVAVSQRGSRKDFVDLYALGQAGLPPGKALDALREKASGISFNPVHIARSLAYFVDAEGEAELLMLAPYEWGTVKRYCLDQSRALLRGLGVEL